MKILENNKKQSIRQTKELSVLKLQYSFAEWLRKNVFKSNVFLTTVPKKLDHSQTPLTHTCTKKIVIWSHLI